MELLAAARRTDEITHGYGMVGMIGGALLVAAVGAIVLIATAATGGLALVIFAGAVAGGGLAGKQVMQGMVKMFNLPEPCSGFLADGSPDVLINRLNAQRAGVDYAHHCTGQLLTHKPRPGPILIAEGSQTVYVNGSPMARLTCKLVCGAYIKSGSPDTFVGGPTLRVLEVHDNQELLENIFKIITVGAAIVAGVVVAVAAFVAGGVVACILAVVGYVAMIGVGLLIDAGLGLLGDLLGPGGRDLLQGGFGILSAFSIKSPRLKTPALPKAPEPLLLPPPAKQLLLPAPARQLLLPPPRKLSAMDETGKQMLANQIRELSAQGKIDEARAVLLPHLHDRNDMKSLVDVLDVSVPADKGAVWSGNKGAAIQHAESNGLTVLETTNGGKIVNDWPELSNKFPWTEKGGSGPDSNAGAGNELWGRLSSKYSGGLKGKTTMMMTDEKILTGGGRTFRQNEWPVMDDSLRKGEIWVDPEVVKLPEP